MRLSMRRGVAEFVIVLLGVFGALFADGWRESRQEFRAEHVYVDRLITDLAADTQELGFVHRAMDRKLPSIERLMALDVIEDSSAARGVARDLSRAVIWSWSFPSPNGASWEELVATGRLGLIGDVELRDAISRYYSSYRDALEGLEERRQATSLGQIEMQRIPTEWLAPDSTGRGGSPQPRITEAVLADLRTSIDFGQLRRAANAEYNYAQYAARQAENLHDRAVDLFLRLEAYRDAR